MNKRATQFSAIGFGDLHYTNTPPASRNAWYIEELNELISQIGELASTLRPDVVFCTGDWFHRKRLTSHRDVSGLVAALRKHLAPFLPIATVVGNHDCEGNSGRIGASPIKTLHAAGVIRFVDRGAPMVLSKEKSRLLVAGQSYVSPGEQPAANLSEEFGQKAGEIDAALFIAHADLKPGDSPRREYVASVARRIARVLRTDLAIPVAVVNGHLHDDRSITGSSLNLFVAAGSIGRTSSVERELPVAVHVIVSSRQAKARLIPLSPLDDESTFLSVAESSQEAKRNEALERFLAMVADAPGEVVVSLDDLAPLAQQAGYSADVVELAVELIKSQPA